MKILIWMMMMTSQIHKIILYCLIIFYDINVYANSHAALYAHIYVLLEATND